MDKQCEPVDLGPSIAQNLSLAGMMDSARMSDIAPDNDGSNPDRDEWPFNDLEGE